MIPGGMCQDERQVAWGNINISQNQAFIELWVMGSARFLCGTLLNEV